MLGASFLRWLRNNWFLPVKDIKYIVAEVLHDIPGLQEEHQPRPPQYRLYLQLLHDYLDIMVDKYVNRMKTTFNINFDLYKAVKQHGYTKI